MNANLLPPYALPDVNPIHNMNSVDLIVDVPPVAVPVPEVPLPVVEGELPAVHLLDLKQVVDSLGADDGVVIAVVWRVVHCWVLGRLWMDLRLCLVTKD